MIMVMAAAAAGALRVLLAARGFLIIRSVRDERGIRLFVLGSRHNEVGWCNAIPASPRELLLVGHAAAVVPAFIRRCAAARPILAGEGARAIFLRDPNCRNTGDPGENGAQERGGNCPFRSIARRSWEPNAHAENSLPSPETTETSPQATEKHRFGPNPRLPE